MMTTCNQRILVPTPVQFKQLREALQQCDPDHKWTQAGLAHRFKVTVITVSLFERGKIQKPRQWMVQAWRAMGNRKKALGMDDHIGCTTVPQGGCL